ncbi:programmed cell death protein 7 [Xiphias gladius]|uniref:programmed cell death protein 7 n=1 Tax=Xiphias gladius TaxID=8245 RepID=UPI001A998CAE|nr:programmed cell death protein 7 [Xiphias gladius]XP_039989231.1 programmed cell death protein 7 [Xiphias gladius]
MDNTYQYRAPSEKQQPAVYTDGFLETPYNTNRPPPNSADPEPTQWAPSSGPTQTDHAAPRWTPPPGYVSHQVYGLSFPAPSSRVGGFRGPRLAPPYGFDLCVPPPPFGCPSPGHFPITVPSAPVNTCSNLAQLRAGPHPPEDDFQQVSDFVKNRQKEYADLHEAGAKFGGPHFTPPLGQDPHWRPGTTTAQPEDDAAFQRRRDAHWLRQFLQSRGKVSKSPHTQKQRSHQSCVPALREALYGAAQLISALEKSCQTLKHNVENDCVWTDSYLTVLTMKRALQETVKLLSDGEWLNILKAKLSRVGKRRARRWRTSKLLQLEEKHKQEHISEREAAIDTWRIKQIHEVEERKKEQELKLAADSVLCEVRKKQADVKRMQDILRSLEKLRRLRKEAASRKGIVTAKDCDEVFSSRLEQLRSVMKRRTAVYSAEEKALMVMLEGEQEEERRREQERRVQKERERQLQRKHRVDAMLFGDQLPVDSILQPFSEYYNQAQHSLQALIQIRREWDVFMVAADHPDGSWVPQSWILPDPPSDQDWASALHAADTD